MAQPVVQQFVSADGFAADSRGEFTLFDGLNGDSSDFDENNLRWLGGVGGILLGADTYRMFVNYWPTAQSDDGHGQHQARAYVGAR